MTIFHSAGWRLVLPLLIALSTIDQATAADASGLSKAISREFFGLHIHRAGAETPWPDVPFGTWRLWDARVQWPHIEPARGQWDFRKLDRLIGLAEQKNVSVVLPLGLSPTWASARPDESSAYKQLGWAAEPRDIEDWRRYVRTVVTRYKGRVGHYEIWNEPNLTRFYSGSASAIKDLTCAAYQIIHEVDPLALVISPSATEKEKGVEWLRSFLALGGGECIDIVGFHFYTYAHEKPELIGVLAGKLRAVMQERGEGLRPIWNTESGWYFANRRMKNPTPYKVIDLRLSGAYLIRAFVVAAGAGVERFYWYSWDNNFMGGLVEPDSPAERKPAAYAYQQAVEILERSRVAPCTTDLDGVTGCLIVSADGRQGIVVWAAGGPRQWRVPPEWSGRSWVRLGVGPQVEVASTDVTMTVDEFPVIVY